MAFTNIVFDMGDVLVHDDMPAFAAGYTKDPADQEQLYQELMAGPEWVEWDRGTLNADEVAKLANKRLPRRLHTACRSVLADWHMDPEPVAGMAELIERLKRAGNHIYLLSNTATSFYDYRHLLPGIQFFDGEFISADHHLLKPERAIYDAFVEHFGLVAESCFFVDDKVPNVEGAIAAGWGGYAFALDVETLEITLRKAGVALAD